MRTFDFAPLYRSTVGFDRVFDLLDQANRVEPMTGWPPYDIERISENDYRITMAVAGFSPDEIELTHHEGRLLVQGHKPEPGEAVYLHRGIAHRSFRQSFNLADHVTVASANLRDGLLVIELKREIPEEMKPRRIEIRTAADRASTEVPQVPHQDNRKAA